MLFSCLKTEHGKKHGAMDPVPAVQEVGPPLLETAASLPSAQVINGFLDKKQTNKKKSRRVLNMTMNPQMVHASLFLICLCGLHIGPFCCMPHCDHVLLFPINFYFYDMRWSQALFNEDLKLEGFIEGGREVKPCVTSTGIQNTRSS